MASGTVYDAIRTLLTAQWTTTTIAWENEGYTKPEPPAAWVMVEVTGTLYAPMSIGSGIHADDRWDEEGTVWIHVLVPTGTGTSLQRSYCKTIADIFRGTTLLDGDLEFLDASIGMGDQGDDEGNYWRVTVAVDWRRMEA